MADKPFVEAKPVPWDPAWYNKLLADAKTPAFLDMQPFASAQQRNIEALIKASKVAAEGAQAVTRWQMEFFSRCIAAANESMQALASTDTPQAKSARQAEIAKVWYERMISDMRELRDLIQRANTETMDVLHGRLEEAMDEVKARAEKTK